MVAMQQDQPLVEFRPSTVHGMGGFASAPISAGAAVIEYLGDRINKQESINRCAQGNACIFYLDDSYDLDGAVERNSARFLNHSCSPNCEAQLRSGRIWIVALQDIRAGEEITFNYNYDLEHYREHPCRCGSPNCIGFIVAEELFDHVRAQEQRRT